MKLFVELLRRLLLGVFWVFGTIEEAWGRWLRRREP